MLERLVKPFLLALVLTGCLVSYPKAQILEKSAEDIEVPIIQKIGSTYFRCFFNNGIYDETNFKKLIATKKGCGYAGALMKPDFNTQTLIGYGVGGDCHMKASVKVFRSDTRKKYIIKITTYWGRCRAGGSFEGWLTIEKIPADYSLEFHKSESATNFPLLN